MQCAKTTPLLRLLNPYFVVTMMPNLLSVRSAADSISMHLSRTVSPVARRGDRGPPRGLKLGDSGPPLGLKPGDRAPPPGLKPGDRELAGLGGV